jgi:phosphatidylserine/phosphatidylglycerophosphate/cardiolipin synthase-like enzyme
MENLVSLLHKSLEKQMLDKETKKEFKELLSSNLPKTDDLNFLSHKAFLLLKEKEKINSFDINWLEDVLNTINLFRIEKNADEIVCFSPQNHCSETICDFLDKAENSIQICVFTISDDSITKKITQCHERGVKIKIITDNDKQYDRGSDINYLAGKGLEIKIDMSHHHMHHKFAIVDNKSILTGSYNWTRSAEKYNQENLIITDSANMVQLFKNEFKRLWEQMEAHKNIK